MAVSDQVAPICIVSTNSFYSYIQDTYGNQKYRQFISVPVDHNKSLSDSLLWVLSSIDWFEEINAHIVICIDSWQSAGASATVLMKVLLKYINKIVKSTNCKVMILDTPPQIMSSEGAKFFKNLGVDVVSEEFLIFGNVTRDAENESSNIKQKHDDFKKQTINPFDQALDDDVISSSFDNFINEFDNSEIGEDNISDSDSPNPFIDLVDNNDDHNDFSFVDDDFMIDDINGDVFDDFLMDDNDDQDDSVYQLGAADAESLNQLTGSYSGSLSSSDVERLINLSEPEFDYEQLQEVGKKKLFGGKTKTAYGEVGTNQLATSIYIREQEDKNGYYSLPADSQIISCFSTSGGVGTSTVSSMLAIQLNYYFNRDLLMRQSSSIKTRVLILSLDEFDDLPVKGIGYTNPLAGEYDGKNIFSLHERLLEVGDNLVWEDISSYFVVSPENFVFYLPQRTIREHIETGTDLTDEDYKRIFEVLTRFFQFIIVDTPSTLYTQSGGRMELLFGISDIIIFVEEPSTKSTVGLFRLIDAWKDSNDQFALDPKQCLLVINKYVEPGSTNNPYFSYIPLKPQILYSDIIKSMHHIFGHDIALPLTEYSSYGNILFGRDPNIKRASAALADKVLSIIDENSSGS